MAHQTTANFKKGKTAPTFILSECVQKASNTMASHLETIFNGCLLPSESNSSTVTVSSAPYDNMLPLKLDDVTSAIQTLPSRKAP
ncbi:hypothetical protein CU098_002962, partial [Rhizopus stolonifer]